MSRKWIRTTVAVVSAIGVWVLQSMPTEALLLHLPKLPNYTPHSPSKNTKPSQLLPDATHKLQKKKCSLSRRVTRS